MQQKSGGAGRQAGKARAANFPFLFISYLYAVLPTRAALILRERNPDSATG
jgi:hypothetical protein